MVIQRAGMFTLDTRNPRFYTLCGRLHVKVALAIVIVFITIIELLEWAAYIFYDELGENTDWSQALFSTLHLLSLLSMMIAFVCENSALLVPYLLFMIFSVTTFIFWVFQLFTFALFPYSERAESFFGFTDDTPFLKREKIILIFLAVLATITTGLTWFLYVGFNSYVYFQSRENEKKMRLAAASAPKPPLVNQAVAAQPPVQTVVESFNNKNFSITDDEDDFDDDDDKVFEQKPGPSMV